MTIFNGHFLVQQPSPVEGGEIVEVLVTMVTISDVSKEVSKEVKDRIMVKDNLPAGLSDNSRLRQLCLDHVKLDIIGIAESKLVGNTTLSIPNYIWIDHNRTALHKKSQIWVRWSEFPNMWKAYWSIIPLKHLTNHMRVFYGSNVHQSLRTLL